jgi:hypothetical protein
MKDYLSSVENELQLLFPVRFEFAVGTDEGDAFGNCLGYDQPVGRVVMPGNRLQACKGVEMLFLYVIDCETQVLPDIVKDVFGRFPSSGLDSTVLKHVDKFLYTLGTDMDDVSAVVENVKDVLIQLVTVNRVEYENVRVDQIAHTVYFMMAFMSYHPPIPSGYFLIHSPAFDNLPGWASIACLSALLFAYFSASLCAFLAALSSFVMILFFYDLQWQRYVFSRFSKNVFRERQMKRHTPYFIAARMSYVPPSPSGCFLIHSPIFDNLPGWASMACLSALLFAYFSASLCAFLAALSSFVMILLFYNLQRQRYEKERRVENGERPSRREGRAGWRLGDVSGLIMNEYEK